MTRIGSRQLDLLIMTASPTCTLISTDKVSAALVRLGLLRECEPGGACCITPAGLRRLADEMAAGRVDDALVRMKKEVDARRAKRAAKEKGLV